jgi:hypothetical protein
VVSPDSHRITRVRRYSGIRRKSIDFHVRGYHPLWQAFPHLSINRLICNFHISDPTTPKKQAPLVWAVPRSLATTNGISLISFPLGTKMFQFPRLPSQSLFFQLRDNRGSLCWVSPFGDPRIYRLYTAPRGLSQCPTSFFGTLRQGIHRKLLIT